VTPQSGAGYLHRSGNHLVLQEAGLDRPVEQRNAAAGLETDQLGQQRIAGDDPRLPAGEILLQPVAQQGIPLGQLLGLADALAVGDW
jgi:hypothetical protein